MIARAHFEEAINDPQKTKQAAERDEKARREKFAENGVIIDEHDFDHGLN